MTRMYPPRVSAKAKRAERDMFEYIREAAGSQDYHCLHSLGLAEHEKKEYAEADFIIVGPAGVFTIEAKGGHIERTAGVWTIGWPGSSYASNEGPFEQSEKTTYPLRKYLQRELGIARNGFLLGWGVAFPHVTFTIRSPEWDNAVVYDDRDVAMSFVRYIERLERHFLQRRKTLNRPMPPRLNEARIKEIVSVLRGDFELVQTVRSLIGDSRRELASLSAAQFSVLDFALNDHNPKILCDGAAGTGKTLIAMEATRRLAAEGKKVLLLCFNTQLSRFLASDAIEAGDAVKISTVHKFMVDLIRRGGFDQQLRSASAAPDYFASIVPGLFEKAAYALIEEDELPQYDVIVLDEAQDVLNGPIMNCLDLVLSGGFRSGRWLVFLDTNLQSKIYIRMDEQVLEILRSYGPSEFVMRDNYRNPKAVITELCGVTGADAPVCRRALRSTVDYRVFVNDREEGQKLKALIIELMRDGVAPGSISILSGKTRDEACVTRHPPDVGQSICHIEDETGHCPIDAISAASVSAFKGLENDVIILTDVPQLDPLSDWGRAVLYVGMTRARSKLFMLVDKDYLDARSRC